MNTIGRFCKNYPLKSEINKLYIEKEKRYYFYKNYELQSKIKNDFENEHIKDYNKAIKYNNTIVFGNKQFHDLINKINLPCEKIYYVKDDDLFNFFRCPKKLIKIMII